VTAASLAHPLLAFSPHESARFGLRIFRGAFERADAEQLAEEIRNGRVDIAIVRVATDAPALLAAMNEDGLPAIAADRLVEYAADLGRLVLAPAKDVSLRLRRASAEDSSRIESTVREVFAGYASHYLANARFDPADVLAGYAEWAMRHVLPNADGRSAWLVEAGGEIVGFSCVQRDATGQVRGVLNGILPAHRGCGLYRDMLRAILREAADSGATRFVISTQSHNAAVQHVWTGEGLVFDHGETTIHVNALLGHGQRRAGAV